MKPRTTKPRKPKQFKFRGFRTANLTEKRGLEIWYQQSMGYWQAKHARKLAAWLIKAADYLESKEK